MHDTEEWGVKLWKPSCTEAAEEFPDVVTNCERLRQETSDSEPQLKENTSELKTKKSKKIQ